MRYINGLILVALLSILGACQTIQRLTDQLEEYGERYESIKTAVVEIKEGYKKADTNGDNKVSKEELLAWLVSGGGLATIVTLIRNAKSNERKTKIEADLASVKRSVAP